MATMKFSVEERGGEVKTRTLVLTRVEDNTHNVYIAYSVTVDGKEIGRVRRAMGRVDAIKNGRLNGMRETDRWFAKTPEGEELAPVAPYNEGYATRLEALSNLLQKVLNLKQKY